MNLAADLEADTAGGCRVVLTIPAKPEYVALGRLAVAALGGWAELSAETVADLKMAVTEACETFLTRVAGAGAVGEPTIGLEVSFDVADERWLVTVTALGPGTAAVEADLTPLPAEATPESEGLGPAIIRALVDELELEDQGAGPPRLRFAKTVR